MKTFAEFLVLYFTVLLLSVGLFFGESGDSSKRPVDCPSHATMQQIKLKETGKQILIH